MDVSIIIINYNTDTLLKECINSILLHTNTIEYEVIVVDNNSPNNKQKSISEEYPFIKLIELKENVGFGRANNIGVETAKGRNIFFLNPDTLLLNNSVKILSDFLDQNHKVGVCGGNLYTKDMKPNFSFRPYFPTLLTELNLLTGNLLFKLLVGRSYQFNYTEKSLKVAYITGADMMVSRKCLNVTGLFDPDFFMYYEETELSLRIKKSGFEIYSVPEANIIHFEGGSFSVNKEAQRLSLISRSIYLKKANKSILYRFISNLVYFTICVIGIFRAKIKNNKLNYNYWLFSFKQFCMLVF